MKILFLDIDGVCNNRRTRERQGDSKYIGIKPELAQLVRDIVAATDCKVVLSSSWRLFPNSEKWASDHVCEFYDKTIDMQKGSVWGVTERGHEIKDWLDHHPEVTKYAILDDNSDMLPEQMSSFFQTTWDDGLTPEIRDRVIGHLNG